MAGTANEMSRTAQDRLRGVLTTGAPPPRRCRPPLPSRPPSGPVALTPSPQRPSPCTTLSPTALARPPPPNSGPPPPLSFSAVPFACAMRSPPVRQLPGSPSSSQAPTPPADPSPSPPNLSPSTPAAFMVLQAFRMCVLKSPDRVEAGNSCICSDIWVCHRSPLFLFARCVPGVDARSSHPPSFCVGSTQSFTLSMKSGRQAFVVSHPIIQRASPSCVALSPGERPLSPGS